MKINPEALNRIDRPTAPSKADIAFGDALAAKIEQTRRTSDAGPLAGIAQVVSKTDLADPSKADAIIKQAVHEIINREFGNMCPPDREQVAAWLDKDPVMREALLRHITLLAS